MSQWFRLIVSLALLSASLVSGKVPADWRRRASSGNLMRKESRISSDEEQTPTLDNDLPDMDLTWNHDRGSVAQYDYDASGGRVIWAGSSPLPLENMVSWFRSEDADEVWPSYVGDFKGTVHDGVVQPLYEAGHGIRYLAGNTVAKFNFGHVIPKIFTICSLSRYAGPNRKRVLVGSRANHANQSKGRGVWLHGHEDGFAGVVNYNDQPAFTDQINRSNLDWVVTCASNTPARLYVDGVPIELTQDASEQDSGDQDLQINFGDSAHDDGSQASDWAVAEVMTWSRALSHSELYQASQELTGKLNQLSVCRTNYHLERYTGDEHGDVCIKDAGEGRSSEPPLDCEFVPGAEVLRWTKNKGNRHPCGKYLLSGESSLAEGAVGANGRVELDKGSKCPISAIDLAVLNEAEFNEWQGLIGDNSPCPECDKVDAWPKYLALDKVNARRTLNTFLEWRHPGCVVKDMSDVTLHSMGERAGNSLFIVARKIVPGSSRVYDRAQIHSAREFVDYAPNSRSHVECPKGMWVQQCDSDNVVMSPLIAVYPMPSDIFRFSEVTKCGISADSNLHRAVARCGSAKTIAVSSAATMGCGSPCWLEGALVATCPQDYAAIGCYCDSDWDMCSQHETGPVWGPTGNSCRRMIRPRLGASRRRWPDLDPAGQGYGAMIYALCQAV